MKYLTTVALLFCSSCILWSGCEDAGLSRYPGLVRIEMPGLRGYSLVHRNEGQSSLDTTTLYIVKGEHAPDSLVGAFSFVAESGRCWAGDTNVVVYTRDTEDSTYLVALRLGDRPVADTLYVGRIGARGNPIPQDGDLMCSMRDSVFYFHDWRGRGRRESFVWKLLPDRTWQKLLQLPGLVDWSIAGDFSEMLFCTDSSGRPQFPWGTLFRLDLSRDSLYRLTEMGSGIKEAERISQDLPMLVLQMSDTDGNIWAFRPGVGARRVTNVRPPEYASWFLFEDDYLKYHVYSHLLPNYSEVRYLPLSSALADSVITFK